MFVRNSKFKAAVTGALAIAAFSLLGGAYTAAAPASATFAAPTHPLANRDVTPQVSGATSWRPTATPSAIASTPPSPSGTPAPTTEAAAGVQPPAHVVIVLEAGVTPAKLARNAPYIASLQRHGANFPKAYAGAAASQPNDLALFSGSTHGVTGDSCPHSFGGANLASELIAAGQTFVGYAESMPSDGYRGCTHGRFTRTHTPWANFANVPASSSRRWSRFPQGHFAKLPTVSIVVPNRCDDMGACPVAQGDAWLKTNLSRYATWAKTHNSLLIVAFDGAAPLVVYGGPVKPGTYRQKVDRYGILRTLTDMYSLPCLTKACDAKSLTPAVQTQPRQTSRKRQP